jgi:hypothetical protein
VAPASRQHQFVEHIVLLAEAIVSVLRLAG